MKNKNVLILSGLVVAFGLYAYFGEYQREINETAQKEADAKIITLNRDQINKVVLDKGAATKVVLEKTTDGWNVVEPLKDQADNEITESFIDQLAGEKIVDVVGTAANIIWMEYGLDPAMGSITLETNSGKKQRVQVSTKKNFENLVFLKRDDENRVLTSSMLWQDSLSKPADHFRNFKLFRSSISKVDGISYQNSKTKFNLQMQDGQWIAPAQPKWKLDQNAVREILTQMNVTKGLGIEKKPPQGAPVMTIQLTMGKEKWQGQIFKASAKVNPPNLHLKIGPEALDKMRDLTLMGLRDKTVPFTFQRDLVSKIHVKNPLKSFQLVKDGDLWRLEKPDTNITVDSVQANDFIERLHRMEVYQYADKQPFANVPMESEIQLLDEKDKIIFEMRWSASKNNEAIAKTNLLNENFKIDDAQIHKLLTMAVVTSKSEKSEEKQEKK